jgi:hypothetical protein
MGRCSNRSQQAIERALNLHLQLGDASERNRSEWGMTKLVVLLEEIGNNLADECTGIVHRRHAQEKNRGKPCSSRERLCDATNILSMIAVWLTQAVKTLAMRMVMTQSAETQM